VWLEVFKHLYMSIAEQMGFTLQNTAYSVTFKERARFFLRDVFDPDGNLVANPPPHSGWHLGSMSEKYSHRYSENAGRGLVCPAMVYVLKRALITAGPICLMSRDHAKTV